MGQPGADWPARGDAISVAGGSFGGGVSGFAAVPEIVVFAAVIGMGATRFA